MEYATSTPQVFRLRLFLFTKISVSGFIFYKKITGTPSVTTRACYETNDTLRESFSSSGWNLGNSLLGNGKKGYTQYDRVLNRQLNFREYPILISVHKVPLFFSIHVDSSPFLPHYLLFCPNFQQTSDLG